MTKILRLNLKKKYFEQIRDGSKTEEYRLVKPFWMKRMNQQYDEIYFFCGYPSKNDTDRLIIKPWSGYTIKTIIDPFFGSEPVEVFAIHIN